MLRVRWQLWPTLSRIQKAVILRKYHIFSINSGAGLEGLGFQGTQIPTPQITMKSHIPACFDRTVVLIAPCVEFHVS